MSVVLTVVLSTFCDLANGRAVILIVCRVFRYYFDAIFGPYKKYVIAGLDAIKGFPIDVICCAHGPVLNSRITELMEKYREWSQVSETRQFLRFHCTTCLNRGFFQSVSDSFLKS